MPDHSPAPNAPPAGRGAMARYALGVGLGFAGALGLWVALFFASFGRFETVPDRKVGAWLQVKRDAIALKSGPPKIVLAGASNVLYGLSAATIEERLGVPCLNLGTHAALPFDYLTTLWKTALAPGDLLVLSVEWRFLVRGTGITNDVFAGYMLGGDPEYFWKMDRDQQVEMMFGSSLNRLLAPLLSSREAEEKRHREWRDRILKREIRPNGDFFNHLAEKRMVAQVRKLMTAPKSDIVTEADLNFGAGETRFWKKMAKFLRWCRGQGVEVVFVAPSLLHRPEFSAPKFARFFEAAEAHYRALGVPVLTVQAENFFPEELMFNTIYHLNDRGMALRTGRVIPLLEPVVRRHFASAPARPPRS